MEAPSARHRSRAACLALAAAAAALLPACRDETTHPKRINLSLILGTKSEWYQGAARWKQLVEDRTSYRVKLIPNASLSGKGQSGELQAVQLGHIEASLESTILLSTLDPRWAVFSFPMLFPSHGVANAVCDGAAGQDMLGLLEERNLVGLAYGVNGFRQVTNNRRAIRTPGDLRGLKLRIPQGLPPEIFTHFGASAHHMNFGELFVTLRTGDMHGQENPLSVIHAAQLSGVQTHVTLWDYVYDPIVLCLNRDFWLSLPEADRATLRQCAKEALAYERGLVARADRELPAALEDKGMAVARLTDAEIAAFRAEREALRPHFERLVGKELLDRFEAACTQAEASR